MLGVSIGLGPSPTCSAEPLSGKGETEKRDLSPWLGAQAVLVLTGCRGSYRDGSLFSFFLSFLAAPWHLEFPGQRSDLSCSCDLSTAATRLDP